MYKWYIRTNCINNKSAHKNEHTEQQLIERKSFYWMPKMVCSICIGRSTHANDAHMFSYSLVVVQNFNWTKNVRIFESMNIQSILIKQYICFITSCHCEVSIYILHCQANHAMSRCWINIEEAVRMLVLFYSTFSRRLYLFLFQAISTVEATMA